MRRSVQAAAAESRDQFRSRVDQAQDELDQATQDAPQKADQVASDALPMPALRAARSPVMRRADASVTRARLSDLQIEA